MTLSRNQLIATAITFVIILMLAIASCTGGDERATSDVSASVPDEPTTTRVAPTQDGEAVTRVPGGRTGSRGAPRNDALSSVRDTPASDSVLSTLPGGVNAVAEQVDWPDRRQVASRTVRAATIIATLYGRELAPTTAALRPMMNRQALLTVRATLSIDPPPASVRPARARVIAANLERDPETGIRSAEVQVNYPDAPSNQRSALVNLQFAASSPQIIGWTIQPD